MMLLSSCPTTLKHANMQSRCLPQFRFFLGTKRIPRTLFAKSVFSCFLISENLFLFGVEKFFIIIGYFLSIFLSFERFQVFICEPFYLVQCFSPSFSFQMWNIFSYWEEFRKPLISSFSTTKWGDRKGYQWCWIK